MRCSYISIFVVGVHLRRSSTELGHSCIVTLRDGILPCRKDTHDHQPHRAQRHETRKEKMDSRRFNQLPQTTHVRDRFYAFSSSSSSIIIIERALHYSTPFFKLFFILYRQPPHRHDTNSIKTINRMGAQGPFFPPNFLKTLAARVLHFTSLHSNHFFFITVFFSLLSFC